MESHELMRQGTVQSEINHREKVEGADNDENEDDGDQDENDDDEEKAMPHLVMKLREDEEDEGVY